MPRVPYLIKRVKQGIDGCILVDLDKRSGTQLWNEEKTGVFNILGIMGVTPEWIRFDRTNKGWHMIIKPLQPLSYQDILTAQAILGDDRKRAAFNFKRLQCGVWLNQLFEYAPKTR